MTYLTGVVQNWFEVGLNQEDPDILQDWLSDWNLFVDKLCRHFGLSDPIGEVANMLDNLHLKPGDKISTYNVDFIYYASQLGWGNSVLCHCYYQRLPNRIQDPISTWEQGKASISSSVTASQSKTNLSLAALSAKNPSSKPSPSPTFKKQPNTPRVDLSSKLASNGKLTSDKCKKHLKNNLCLYYSAEEHKLDSCPKKQTTVSSKGCSVLATADTPAATSEKPLEK